MSKAETIRSEFRVENSGLRLDQFLALQFPAVSLTAIRRIIRDGNALINHERGRQGWILQAGDMIVAQLDPTEPTSALPEDISLDVLLEDDDLLIINKPTGMLSHPSHKEKSGSVMNAVSFHLLHRRKGARQDAARPILLHRLDRDTSGVLALALTERAGRIVSKAFRDRKVEKSYIALVYGAVKEASGLIDAPIGRAPGQWPRWRVEPDGAVAQTKYTVTERLGDFTLLTLEPMTGRTHQLRIHLAHLGHPIVGDQVYRGTNTESLPVWPGVKPKHQLLHAASLSLRHPNGGEAVAIEAPLPEVFRTALDLLRAR